MVTLSMPKHLMLNKILLKPLIINAQPKKMVGVNEARSHALVVSLIIHLQSRLELK